MPNISEYTERDLMRLARRHHNTKRTYLLVDPLQGKHVPVSPTRALTMMRALGRRMDAALPGIDLVIGFAETATAVAAAAAEGLGRPVRYLHTTREDFPAGPDLGFREEHSHAVDHRLCLNRLLPWLEQARAVALVDDELSTGRTLQGAVAALRLHCPALRGKPLLAGSILSRLSDERLSELAAEGIRAAALLRLPLTDYTQAVQRFAIRGATPPEAAPMPWETLSLPAPGGDLREGVELTGWLRALREGYAPLLDRLAPRLQGRRVELLGTEEYMLPGLIFGEMLEARGVSARFHATTRSPIGLCADEGYPIRNGWQLHSFYAPDRTTYIYNLAPCDAALVLTDTPDSASAEAAMADLSAALGQAGCREILLLREEKHVQHI